MTPAVIALKFTLCTLAGIAAVVAYGTGAYYFVNAALSAYGWQGEVGALVIVGTPILYLGIYGILKDEEQMRRVRSRQ